MSRILICSINYAPEPTGVGVMSANLAESLAAGGHQVKVVCGAPHYPYWSRFEGYEYSRVTRLMENGVEVIRCPLYIPENLNAVKRLTHYFSFVKNAFRPMKQTARAFKPDLVFHVAPSLIAAPLAIRAARSIGAKSWLHIQDFEVEAAFATNYLKSTGVIASAARGFERRIFGAFDQVSSISPQMCAKIEKFGVSPDRIYEFRNWADTDNIKPSDSTKFREKWNINTPHVAFYSGNIAFKQGIEIIPETARLMADRKDLTFVICGNGSARAELERRYSGLSNLQIYDLQPREDLNDLLNMATVHLLPQKADAADLVLPSKLANMLATGRPVIAGVKADRGLADEVAGCGVIFEPENPAALSDAINSMLDDPDAMETFGKAGRLRAEQRWSREAIIDGLQQRIGHLVE